ncbi:MAG: type II secretion system GspH family protein [Phycisphaerales bacterium]|nr:type II secretion system protein [Planctomycetota bacterium]MCH8509005.1 type II secretion system GspH family protein [Phycisphaerales bacterium]
MPKCRRPRAFTLVELLVVIGVIALLIGILVPAIGKTLDRSRELASAVNLRSIGQIFEIYTGNARGMYPAPIPGRMYPSYIPDIAVSMAHWHAATDWPGLFADTHPWWEYERLYLAPGAERILEGPVITLPKPSFDYSSSFLGHPGLWAPDRDIDIDQIPRFERSVTQSMVRYPASKVLMWDIEMPYLRRPLERDDRGNLRERTPMLFADQHVANHIPAEATQGITNPAPTAARLHENIHNTPHGVHGRDY